jgi:hypothetical protein
MDVKETMVEHVVPLPDLFTICFEPKRIVVATVPTDLKLIILFAIYDKIAKTMFVAQKNQDIHINRAIWFYGVDFGHAFNTLNQHIRYNVMIMAFLWMSDFDPRYCKPGCRDFVIQFIKVCHSTRYTLPTFTTLSSLTSLCF